MSEKYRFNHTWWCLVILAMLLTVMSVNAFAATVDSGTYHEYTWELDTNGTLTIGNNPSYIPDGTPPDTVTSAWTAYSDAVVNVVIEPGVTSIANGAFREFFSLKSITIPENVISIGSGAFKDSAIYAVRFTGDAPVIAEDAFTNVIATCYYPADNESWADAMHNYGGTLTWKSVCSMHSYGEGIIITTPTCVDAGTMHYPCLNCDFYKDEPIDPNPNNHTYRRYTKASTCTIKGSDIFICDLCEDRYTEELPLAPHTSILINSIDPTCNSMGYSGDRICDVCKVTLEIGHFEPRTDHNWTQWITVIPATFTHCGTQRRTCTDCDKVEEQSIEKIPQNTLFTDVPEDTYYYDSVLWAHRQGITAGKTLTQFAPNDVCLRSEVVTFLWRAMANQDHGNGANPFVDVKSGDYFYDAVLWAMKNDITNGMDSTHFGPTLSCTRAQVVTFLWRASGSPTPDSSGVSFEDVDPSEYYACAVQWAVETGITNGTDANRPVFSPGGTCTRAQIVTFLYRWIGATEQPPA